MTDKPKKPKAKLGRKPMYVTHVEPSFDLITGYLRAGYTEESTAKAIGVSWTTWKVFKGKYAAFSTVIKKAKEDTTALVVNKLFQRATGYDYEETHTEIKETTQGKTKLIRKITKHVPADVGAAIFWLCNRDREKWRNAKYEEHNGEGAEKLTIEQQARLMHELTAPMKEGNSDDSTQQ
jgi:hypothetical protein